MKRFFAFALTLFVVTAVQIFAASDYLLEIDGIKGEVIKASSKSSNGRISLNGLPPGQPVLVSKIQWNGGTYTVYVPTGIVSPRDAASGLPTGKRMHKPFVVLHNGEVFDFDTKDQAVAKAKEIDGKTKTRDTSSSLILQISKSGTSFTYQKIEWTW